MVVIALYCFLDCMIVCAVHLRFSFPLWSVSFVLSEHPCSLGSTGWRVAEWHYYWLSNTVQSRLREGC